MGNWHTEIAQYIWLNMYRTLFDKVDQFNFNKVLLYVIYVLSARDHNCDMRFDDNISVCIYVNAN